MNLYGIVCDPVRHIGGRLIGGGFQSWRPSWRTSCAEEVEQASGGTNSGTTGPRAVKLTDCA